MSETRHTPGHRMPTRRGQRPSAATAVADRWAGPHERIVEFNANDGTGRGGLISLRVMPSGEFRVSLYRMDGVTVDVAPETPHRAAEGKE